MWDRFTGQLPSYREWIEIALTGAVGGAVGGLLLLVYKFGADTGDLLNFLGGAVGAGLALVGALWIEAKRRKDQHDNVWASLGQVGLSASRCAFAQDDLLLVNLLGLHGFCTRFLHLSDINKVDSAMLATMLFPARTGTERLLELAEESISALRRDNGAATRVAALIRPQLMATVDLCVDTLREANFGHGARKFAKDLAKLHREQIPQQSS